MPDEMTTAATLEAVLADHDWLTPRGYAWPCCTCGVEFPGGEDDAYAHVAAAVRSWLADRLADEGLREAVCYRVEVDERHVEGALAGEQGETGSGCRGAGERLSGAEEGEVA